MEQYLPNFRLPTLNDLLQALELETEEEMHERSRQMAINGDGDDGDGDGDDELDLEGEGVSDDDDSDDDDDDDDDSDDDEDEMEKIGRLPRGLFSHRISFDYTNWLFASYLAPHGEPSVVIPAQEPEQPPPMEPVDPRSRARASSRANLAQMSAESTDEITEEAIRSKIAELKQRGFSDRARDIEIQRLMTEAYYRRVKRQTATQKGITDKDRQATVTEDGTLGCQHYRRGCKIECSACYKWYTCRMCHDSVEDHTLNRPATRRVICMICGKDQDASNKCTDCGKVFARYYCDICKLWDDDPSKSIYHCDDCKICRIGEGLGKDLFHCKTCNICMAIELQNNHKCIEHSTECDCPICGDFMFTSTEQVIFMKCGHSMHQNCFHQHVKTDYKCPTCKMTIINMGAQFRILDDEVASQPLPEPYSNWRAIVSCNDCHAKSNVPFHILGLKCANCRSYNTNNHKLIKPEEMPETAGRTDLLDISDLPSTEDEIDSDEDDEDDDFQQVYGNILSRVTRF